MPQDMGMHEHLPEIKRSSYPRNYPGGEVIFTVPIEVAYTEATTRKPLHFNEKDVWVHHYYLGPQVAPNQQRRFFDQAYPYHRRVGPMLTAEQQKATYQRDKVPPPPPPSEYGITTLVWEEQRRKLLVVEFPNDPEDYHGRITAIRRNLPPGVPHLSFETPRDMVAGLDRLGFMPNDFDYMAAANPQTWLDNFIDTSRRIEHHVFEVVRATNTRPPITIFEGKQQ